jgi:N-glycosylase/DNA lyase
LLNKCVNCIIEEETCLFRIISSQYNNLKVEISDFNPYHTFLCGQCFRWNVNEDGIWTGIISDLGVRLIWDGKTCTFLNMSKSEFIDNCVYYFDLDTDYCKIKTYLEKKDENLKKAISHGYGIRLLKQDFWETLISFLISQNNNIPRIKQIIESLCSHFGLPVKCYIYQLDRNKCKNFKLSRHNCQLCSRNINGFEKKLLLRVML